MENENKKTDPSSAGRAYHQSIASEANGDWWWSVFFDEYAITKDEARLLNELSINKEDAELYTTLKDDRHNASYATNIKFSQETIDNYESQVLDFINKTEELIQK